MPTLNIYKWSIAVASFIVLLSTVALVASATGWRLGDIFRIGFNDELSASLVEESAVQELDIINENDDFTLKLRAFTGDMETHIVMFELIPKTEWIHEQSIIITNVVFSYIKQKYTELSLVTLRKILQALYGISLPNQYLLQIISRTFRRSRMNQARLTTLDVSACLWTMRKFRSLKNPLN